MDKMDQKKRIMLFGMGDVCYSLIDILNAKVIEEFAARGVECDIVQIVGRKGYTEEIYNRLSSGEYAAALSFNSAGENQLKLTNGENMFDHFNVPFFLFLLDHPMDHVVKLKGAGKGLHVICIDRDHPAYIKRGFSEIEHTHFTLLGGLPAPAGAVFSEEQFEQRPKDIVLTASRVNLEQREEAILSLSDGMRSIALSLLDLLLDERSLDNEQALERVIADKGLSGISGEEFAMLEAMTNSVNIYVRAYVREEIVRTLMASDLKIDIYGKGWEALADEMGPNVRLHAAVPYTETPKIYYDSKLVLNVMPWFKNGSHDRIPSSMLSGAVPLTDHSKLLDEWFLTDDEDKKTVAFYDLSHTEKITGIAKDLLSDTHALYLRSERGRNYAFAHMSWSNTARDVLKFMGIDQ